MRTLKEARFRGTFLNLGKETLLYINPKFCECRFQNVHDEVVDSRDWGLVGCNNTIIGKILFISWLNVWAEDTTSPGART